jgi:hypothetical protein
MLRLLLLLTGVALLVVAALLGHTRTTDTLTLLAFVSAEPGTESNTLRTVVPSDGSVSRRVHQHDNLICALHGGPARYVLLMPLPGSERCTALDYSAQPWPHAAAAVAITRNESHTLDPAGRFLVRDGALCPLEPSPACWPLVGDTRVRWQSPAPQQAQRVALMADFGGVRSVLLARGESVQVVQQAVSLAEMAPAWSVDGRRLAYFVGQTLVVYDIEQDTTRRVATVSATPIIRAAWSPDGQWLAWLGRTTSDGVYVTRLADGHTVALSQSPAQQRGFAWVGALFVLADGGWLYAAAPPFTTPRTRLAPGHSPAPWTLTRPVFNAQRVGGVGVVLIVVSVVLVAIRPRKAHSRPHARHTPTNRPQLHPKPPRHPEDDTAPF